MGSSYPRAVLTAALQGLLTGASIAVGLGMIVGRRQVEKRWLAALTRAGHPLPHRALGVRMGLLSFAGTLPGRLVKVHERRKGF
jgi:hypothetical protein